MKQIFLFSLLILVSLSVAAQKNGVVKGQLMDTIAHQPVAGATITLMKRQDSSLVSFSMTDNQGRFELRGLPTGDFRLLITHINYHNSVRFFSITENKKEVDLASITVYDKAKVLEEVVVTAEAPPVTMIADTIQYNAGSFKTPPNTSVEDLLKKLHGAKVTKDGIPIDVPDGTSILNAARMIGGDIVPPAMCYYSKLKTSGGYCRTCIVKVTKGSEKDPRPMPKPVASCRTTVMDGMEVQNITSPDLLEARAGVVEFLLLNHPLDCPICDQAGECHLQDLGYQNGKVQTRYEFRISDC